MPHGIGMLISLQTLPEFVVGENNTRCSSSSSNIIGELKDLKHLKGQLHISKLENISVARDAKEAYLDNKECLRKLELVWSDKGSGNERTLEIIEGLQPHSNLEDLNISCYPGSRFPSWIKMLSNLQILQLCECKQLNALPPLGRLPLLKYLWIKGMSNIKHVGPEFCGQEFQSLEVLKLISNTEWEEWCFEGGVDDQEQQDTKCLQFFPSIGSLTIQNCPKLRRLPSYRFASLLSLNIADCNELTSPPRHGNFSYGESLSTSATAIGYQEFPFLRYLTITNCPKLRELPEHLPFLVSLHLEQCQELVAVPWVPSLCHLDLLEINNSILFARLPKLSALSYLWILGICLVQDFLQMLTSLENLHIKSCSGLGNKIMDLHYIVSLRHFEIENCHDVKSMTLPPKLQTLSVTACQSLEFFPTMIHNLTCLTHLTISQCSGFTSSPAVDGVRGLWPASLEFLCLKDFSNLDLPSRFWWLHNLTSLQTLIIVGCSSLKHFPNGLLPTLKRLCISDCKNLESLPEQMNLFTSLGHLSINKCSRLVTFPSGGLPKKLEKMQIGGCGDNLDMLPKCPGLSKLTSLE
ncbi:PREDICTED: putative disease resistance protein At3g14460 isoform X1 [Nelumbo nucifera]|uniref:Disease resistance protein At3g14460 isoform X1 n=2 Tax=Nelumbo nucifera TaxID=4432 RepID=A0A1U8B4P8_NELNU|nr:PREDICTED: putative disease resistance protein At3g14460 isoform X1 [Nelumbo nucifera]DAD45260.1 TPA_asm: hypothetical protein HUJ06_003490 [Nelumbo nucifera]